MKRIIKIGANNVQVQTVLYDAEVGGSEVITDIESYGQDRIDRELIIAQETKDEWTDKDVDQYVLDKKSEAQDKLDDLNDIQGVMNE